MAELDCYMSSYGDGITTKEQLFYINKQNLFDKNQLANVLRNCHLLAYGDGISIMTRINLCFLKYSQ